MSEQKMDAERVAFDAAYAEAVEDGWTSTKDLARQIWQKARAGLPVAGVEEVEVVAYRSEKYICGEHYSASRLTFEQPYTADLKIDPLMTVAQHNRIVAALSAHRAGAVGVDLELLGRSIDLLERASRDRPAAPNSWRAAQQLRAAICRGKQDRLVGLSVDILREVIRGDASRGANCQDLVIAWKAMDKIREMLREAGQL